MNRFNNCAASLLAMVAINVTWKNRQKTFLKITKQLNPFPTTTLVTFYHPINSRLRKSKLFSYRISFF